MGSLKHSYTTKARCVLTHENIPFKTDQVVNKIQQVVNTQTENEQKTENKPPKVKIQSALTHKELIEYMYQHIQFDEMPFEKDPLYDHRQIYMHETAHIEYGLYENIEASAAFNYQIQKESEVEKIENKNTQYMYNLG